MVNTRKKVSFSLMISALYGLLTVCIVFYVTPKLGPVPDGVWIAFMLIVPAITVLPLIRSSLYQFPAAIFIGIPVEYVILYFDVERIAHNFSITTQGLSGFTYFFMAATWPIVVTLLQFLILHFGKKYGLSVQRIKMSYGPEKSY